MNLEFVAALFALMPTLSLSSGIDCPNPVDLGIGDRSIIADSQITASSSYEDLNPWKGRLRHTAGYWAASDKGTDNWIQVDFFSRVVVTGIKTQGSAIAGYNEWVRRLSVQTGDTRGSLTYIRDRNNKVILFDANSNRNAIKVIPFPEPMTAYILRIVTRQCHEWCSLRFEVTGCELLNECFEIPYICGDGGACQDLIDGYKCHCPDGFVSIAGIRCEDVNECLLYYPCQNSAWCRNIIGSYTCQCTQGWQGKNCSLDIDECETESLCQNGGSCTNAPGSYTCACTDGWRGNNCDIDIDECETTSPCQNGAPCTNAPGSYTCACTDGWRGRNCNRAPIATTITPEEHVVISTTSGDTVTNENGYMSLSVPIRSNMSLTCTVQGVEPFAYATWTGPLSVLFLGTTRVVANTEKYGIQKQMSTSGTTTDFILEIKNMEKKDAGLYTCQDLPAGMKTLYVDVEDAVATTDPVVISTTSGSIVTNANGEKLLSVPHGSTVSLTCTVNDGNLFDNVIWTGPVRALFYGTLAVNTNREKYGIQAHTSASGTTVNFILEIRNMGEEDTGQYSCQDHNKGISELSVNVEAASATTIDSEEPVVISTTSGNIVTNKNGDMSLSVPIGSTLSLICTVQGVEQFAYAMWTGPIAGVIGAAFFLGTTRVIPNTEKYGIQKQMSSGTTTDFILEIRNMGTDDAGRYSCHDSSEEVSNLYVEVEEVVVHTTTSAITTTTELENPVVISTTSGNIVTHENGDMSLSIPIGSTLSLTCTVQDVEPFACAMWTGSISGVNGVALFLGTTRVNANTEKYDIQKHMLTRTTTEFILEIRNMGKDDAGLYSCHYLPDGVGNLYVEVEEAVVQTTTAAIEPEDPVVISTISGSIVTNENGDMSLSVPIGSTLSLTCTVPGVGQFAYAMWTGPIAGVNGVAFFLGTTRVIADTEKYGIQKQMSSATTTDFVLEVRNMGTDDAGRYSCHPPEGVKDLYVEVEEQAETDTVAANEPEASHP